MYTVQTWGREVHPEYPGPAVPLYPTENTDYVRPHYQAQETWKLYLVHGNTGQLPEQGEK